MLKSLRLLPIFLGLSIFTYAQSHIGIQEPDRRFQEGFTFFYSKQYNQAISSFEEFLKYAEKGEHQAQAMHASLISSIRLYHGNISFKFQRLENTYPSHPLLGNAKIELSGLYFQQKDYDKVIQILSDVNPADYPKEEAHEIRFRLAYSKFAKKSFEDALKGFDFLKSIQGKYRQPSSYYAGYIRYGNNDFEGALKDFLAIEQSEEYKKVVPGLVATIYYRQQDFDKLLQYIESQPSDFKGPDYLPLMLADAYFYKNDFDNAFPKYQKVLELNTIPKNSGLYFRIGKTSIEQSEYSVAVNSFKQINNREDSLYAPAMYFLGLSYLKQKEINLAVAPLQNAISLAKDRELKNDALFLYSTVMIEKSNFKDAIAALEQLSSNMPTANIQLQIAELLAACYLRTNDYESALKYLSAQKNMSNKLRKSYQEAAYYLGLRSFNDGDYEGARSYLSTALAHPINEFMVVSSQYFIAESYGRNKDYALAIAAYKGLDQIPNVLEYNEYFMAQYGLGYAHFNQKEYASALKYFEKYHEALKMKKLKDYYPDALIRWADCLYVLKSYEASLSKYKEAIDKVPSSKDYIYFQIGSIQAVLGMLAESLFSFNKVVKDYPKSIYLPDALFQMAQLSLEESNYVSAVRYYTQVINGYPKNALVPFALNKRAVSFQNLQQYDNAIADYRSLIKNFADHELVKSALLGLQETYASSNRTEDFQEFIEQYKQGKPLDGSLESLEYESAKSLYYNEKYDKTISSIEKFVANYPNSEFRLELTFLLAESFYRTKKNKEALTSYEWVIQKDRNPYLNRSLLRSAEILAGSKQWRLALPHYRMLAEIAESVGDQSTANLGMAECFEGLLIWDSALSAAQVVLKSTGNLSTSSSNKALLISAKAMINLGNLEKAKDPLLQVLNASKDEQAAQASYLLSFIDYKLGFYEKSLASLYEYPSQFGTYEFWLGKAFLLISDNFLAIQEPLQAKATLNSIIEKSPVSEIVTEAKQKLDSIESLEKGRENEE